MMTLKSQGVRLICLVWKLCPQWLGRAWFLKREERVRECKRERGRMRKVDRARERDTVRGSQEKEANSVKEREKK